MIRATANAIIPASIEVEVTPVSAPAGTVVIIPTGITQVSTSRSHRGTIPEGSAPFERHRRIPR